MRRFAWVGLLVVWLVGAVSAADVIATLSFDKPEYFLGENILAHYRMTNNGKKNFLFGNDPSVQWRSTRWVVTATDAKGRAVPDPCAADYHPFRAGIVTGPSSLAPGSSYEEELPLMRFCDFPGPGVYTVRLYHTSEWGMSYDASRQKDSRVQPTPVAEGTLRLVMPNPEEAANVLRQMQALPQNRQISVQKPYADFTALRYPVYLPLLASLAAHGDLRAMVALDAMATPEATRALFQLCISDTRSVAWTARYYLLRRLPIQGDPEPFDRIGPCFPVFAPTASMLVTKVLDKNALLAVWIPPFEFMEQHWRDLSTRSWKSSLCPGIYDFARRLLTREDIDEQLWGALLLKRVGRARDLPLVLGKMDRLLTKIPGDGQTLNEPMLPLCRALQDTADSFIQTGAKLPNPTKSLAAKLVCLDEISRNARYRPRGWQQVATELLKHRLCYVRLSAAYDLPAPLDPQLVTPVVGALQPQTKETNAAFCRIARDTPRPEFAASLINMLTTTQDERVAILVEEAAFKCGVPRDLVMDIYIARIDDPDPAMSQRILGLLICNAVEVHGLSFTRGATITPKELAQLKTRWTTFVNEHRAALRAGTRFAIDSKDVSAHLLLPAWMTLRREDGTEWPPRLN